MQMTDITVTAKTMQRCMRPIIRMSSTLVRSMASTSKGSYILGHITKCHSSINICKGCIIELLSKAIMAPDPIMSINIYYLEYYATSEVMFDGHKS